MMDSHDKTNLPSKSEVLAEALKNSFSVRNSDLLSISLVILTLIGIGWLADSILPFFQDVGILIYNLISNASLETKFGESALKMIFPLVGVLVLMFLLYKNHQRNSQEIRYAKTVAERHKGLIVMLSFYSVRRDKDKKPKGYANPEEIVQAIEKGTLDKNKIFAGCNWGQMAFAVAYHAPVLKKCWVLTTETGSKNHFEQAIKLIKYFAKNVEPEQVEIKDENDIGETANRIKNIYLEAEKANFPTDEIIADFTGATAAMSGGMILATLADDRKIEYIKQDFNNDLSEARLELVESEQIILSPQTDIRATQRLAKK
jgi:hypothetical protein